MQYKLFRQTILIIVLIISACNPTPQITELSNDTITYDETISINNCGNKADSAQTASRSFSTKVSGTGTIKAGYDKIIEGSVSATYEQFRNTTKTQTLTAAPQTNMEFILRWSDDVRTGNATVNGEIADYTVNIPISVAQISSRDLGCDGSASTSTFVYPTETSTAVASMPSQNPTIIFGPVDGELVHNSNDNIVPVEYANVFLADFTLSVDFFNPYSSKEGQWSYGMAFRESGRDATDCYSLEIYWDGSWSLFLYGPSNKGNQIDPISSGHIKNFDSSPTGSNQLRLIVQGDEAFFLANDVLVSNLDVSAKKGAGDVRISTGFYIGQEIQGKSTRFKDFIIWSLP